MNKADIARKYRKEYDEKYKKQFPDGFPTLKLARIMYNENKLVFTNVESARERLRYIEGMSGARHRKEIKKTEFLRDEPRSKNPYNLPNSEGIVRKPYIVSGYKRALVIADIHLPYHSTEAINTTFDYAKKEKPDVVIIDGDLIDCFQLSKFVRDPRQRNFAYELSVMKDFFVILQKTFKCKIIFKFGNHELRYEHFLFMKAKELVGVEEFEFANIIKARTNGIDIVEDKTIIKLNHLDLLHGHEFVTGFFNPVNVARGLQLRAKVSAMQAHSHKTSEHTEVDLHGNIKTTWSIGCLASLSPDFAPYNSWNHGFSLIELSDNKKDFQVRNKRIHKGKIL